VTESSTKPTRRRWWRYLLFVAMAGMLTVIGLLVYVNTASSQNWSALPVAASK
jgi:hypothetical protein